ncbi:MAG: hypothetical protein ABEJ93_03685 [Candidatus Nanohalobium sp.]
MLESRLQLPRVGNAEEIRLDFGIESISYSPQVKLDEYRQEEGLSPSPMALKNGN